MFDWDIKQVADMDYWFVTTSGKHAVNGGMMKRQHPQQPITNYIGVSSVNDYAAKLERLGGKTVVPKTPVQGMGYFAVCLDTENNSFGLWEDDKNAR